MELIHHGAYDGVTGSCHQLKFDNGKSLLVDCGIFQGDDARRHPDLEIEFSLEGVESLILTHVHIDHVGPIAIFDCCRFSWRHLLHRTNRQASPAGD